MSTVSFALQFPEFFVCMAFRVKLKLKKECQIGNNNGLWLIYLHCSLGVEISSSKSNGIGFFFKETQEMDEV